MEEFNPELNEFQKMMIEKYPENAKQFMGKLEKPLNKEERDEAVRKAYADDF